MQIQVHYQNLENSPWIDQFIQKRAAKLDRYLANSANIQIHLKLEKGSYRTSLTIHNPYHDYAFTSVGDNLFESFSLAIDKASRALAEHKKKVKDRIHRKIITANELYA